LEGQACGLPGGRVRQSAQGDECTGPTASAQAQRAVGEELRPRLCETGGARRTHLRGLEPIRKRYLIHAAAHNLSVVMRKVFGHGKPRALQGLSSALLRALWPVQRLLEGLLRITCPTRAHSLGPAPIRVARLICTPQAAMMPQYTPSSTGC